MRRRLTLGFFIGFLTISLFGCSPADHESSDATSPNRNQPNMNNRGANTTNGGSTGSNTTVSTVNSNSGGNAALTADNFWTKAAQGGMAEVELGKLAQQKAQNAEVKKFAQMMVADHTKANDELKGLAAKKSVALPAELDAAHKSMMEKLNGLSGAEFDKAYVDGQVADHEATVNLFEGNADNADPDAKAFATKNLPTVKSHLEMIKGIQSKMK